MIAGNEVVRSRGVGAFQKHIVIRVAGDFQASRRLDDMAAVLDELQQLLLHSLADTQLRAREHVRIFLQNRPRHVEMRGLGQGQHQGGAPNRASAPYWQQTQIRCSAASWF